MTGGKKDAVQFEETTGVVEMRIMGERAQMREFEANKLDDATLASNLASAAADAAGREELAARCGSWQLLLSGEETQS
jgi:hypothetical protein